MSQLLPAQLLTPSFGILGHQCSLWKQKRRIKKNGGKFFPSCTISPFILDSFHLLFFLMFMSVLAPMHRISRNRKNQKPKKKKNQVSSANTVAETLSRGGKGKKNNAGKGMYWQRNLPELNQTFLLHQTKTLLPVKLSALQPRLMEFKIKRFKGQIEGIFSSCSYCSFTEKMTTPFCLNELQYLKICRTSSKSTFPNVSQHQGIMVLNELQQQRVSQHDTVFQMGWSSVKSLFFLCC